jgi:preprotein translocase subunit SecG
MYILLSILIIIVCVLLTLVVLIQNPKGGGIAANFTAPNQIMGAKRSSDLVEKATWILAVVLIVLSLGSAFLRPGGDVEPEEQKSLIKDQIEEATVPASPNAPAPTQTQPTPPADGNTTPTP